MKRLQLITVSSLFVLALSGCGGGSQPLKSQATVPAPPTVTPPPTPPPAPTPTPVPTPPTITSITMTCQTPVASGASSQCTMTILPTDAPQTVTWSASGPFGVVPVSASGLVTAPVLAHDGMVNVIAISTVDTAESASFVIDVNATPPPAPTVKVVGKGYNPQLNVVGTNWIVGFTHDGMTTVTNGGPLPDGYPGVLDDLQNGNALTEVDDPNFAKPNQLFLDGQPVATELSDKPAVIAGSFEAWINGGIFTTASPNPVFTPTGDLTEITSNGSLLAWVEEVGGSCYVWFDSVQVSHEAGNCAQDVKIVVGGGGTIYIGWDDFTAVYVAASKDNGVTWTQQTVTSGMDGVLGVDFIVRADNSLKVVWTQYSKSESGASVWESDSGGLPVRLSNPVRTNFSGAGNPAIAQDGSVVWLDDFQGDASGNFAVVLNGVSLTSSPAVAYDEGPMIRLLPDGTRVVVWGDGATVWMEEVPQ